MGSTFTETRIRSRRMSRGMDPVTRAGAPATHASRAGQACIHTSYVYSHPRTTAQMTKRLPPPAGGRRGRRQIRAPAPKTNNTAAPCTCVQTSIRVAWPRPRIAGRVTAAQCGSGPFGTGAAGGEPPPPPSLKPKASSEASRHPRKSSRRIRACGRPASSPG